MHPQHENMPFPPPIQHTTGEQPQPGGGAATDLKTLAGAALVTFAAGMVVLLGYMMIGGFGAFIGLFGAGFGVVWLAGVHGGKVFPREGFPTKSIGGAAAVSAVLLGLATLMS